MSDDAALLREAVEASVAAKRALLDDGALLGGVSEAADLVEAALRAGGKVLLFGNGGSAADATHIAAELVGRFRLDRRPLPALSLTDNVSSVTAIANDFAYEQVFERQVRAFGASGDVAIGLSTSGGSANVAAGLRAAEELGLRRIAFTGARGGAVADAAELALRMPSDDTPRVQECYLLLCHSLCELVERRMFGR